MDCPVCKAPGMCICDTNIPSVGDIMHAVTKELVRAEAENEPMNSAHEGYAVILEELDELWDIVKLKPKNRDIAHMREEAIQIAAMAVRFIKDVCDGGGRRIY